MEKVNPGFGKVMIAISKDDLETFERLLISIASPRINFILKEKRVKTLEKILKKNIDSAKIIAESIRLTLEGK